MICTNCGRECSAVAGKSIPNTIYTDSIAVSDCCGFQIVDKLSCPCEKESKENCETCRDESTAKNATKGLYSEAQIKEALNRVGVIGFVCDRIIEEIRGK